MRRFGVFLLTVVTAVALAGCSGGDAQRAQDLLQQSDKALEGLASYRFAGRLTVEAEGMEFTLVMRGGGNTRRAPSSYVTMRGEGIPGFADVTVVQSGQSLWLKVGGSWTRTEVPAGQPTGLEQFDLSPYVKDVSVRDGASVDGEPAVKVSGVLDTAGLFAGLLGSFGDTSGLAGLPAGDLEDVFGDIRVVIYISEVTHLPRRTLVDMPIEAEGQKVEVHLDFALDPSKRRVKVPVPTA